MNWSLRRTEQAIDDLADIYDYIALDNPDAAERLVLSIVGTFERTADYPEIGRNAEQVGPGFRLLTRGNYLLIYRLVADEHCVELLRVVHRARDWPSLLDS